MRWITKDRNFYKTVLMLAVPISLQHLVTFLVGFADNVMVGRLGDDAVSGVYLGGQVQFLLQQLVVGLGSALLILAAQYFGKGDLKTVRRLTSLVLRIGVVASAVLSLLTALFPRTILLLFSKESGPLTEGVSYVRILAFSFLFYTVSQLLIFSMRSVQVTRVGVLAAATTLAVNVLLNYLLIFGKLGLPALGVRGAAIATLCARIVECLVVCLYVFVFDRRLSLRLRSLFARVGDLLPQYLRYGLPVIAGDLVWAVNILTQGAIVGRYTADIIAAVSVTNTLNNLIYVWLNGLWGGVSVVIGKSIGEGRIDAVKEYARTCQLLFL